MPNDTPMLTIVRVGRILESRCTRELPASQYRVLGVLAAGDARATQLAARLAVAKPTMTFAVDGLVEKGFVARDVAADDRRSVRISITEAGRVALRAAERELAVVLDDILDRCDDRAAVLAALDDLRRALDARLAERAGRHGDGMAR